MKTLDLHGKRHHEVTRLVEDFMLENELPVRIVTGNSFLMKKLVEESLPDDVIWQNESDWNLGSMIVLIKT